MKLEPGAAFPDLDLPDHTGRDRRLGELAGGDPVALLFSRGWWCPKEQRHLRELVALQDEFEVAYARIVVVSVDEPEVQSAFRAGLGAVSPNRVDPAARPHDPPHVRRLLVLGATDGRGPAPGHACDLPCRARGLPLVSAAARIWFDGSSLSAGGVRGRSFTIDPRCLSGEPVRRAFAHVCALADDAAALAFDQPEVQQVRRDALAWWIPLLGDALVCLTTLALDESRYGGAITVTHAPVDWEYDPFARIFPGTLLRTDLFSHVPPPAGPRDRALRRRGVARRRLLGKPDVEVVVVAGDAADDAGRPSEAGARADMDCLRPHPA